MEFAIGFVAGSLVSGFAVARSGRIFKASDQWLTAWLQKTEAAIKARLAARAEALKSKL